MRETLSLRTGIEREQEYSSLWLCAIKPVHLLLKWNPGESFFDSGIAVQQLSVLGLKEYRGEQSKNLNPSVSLKCAFLELVCGESWSPVTACVSYTS